MGLAAIKMIEFPRWVGVTGELVAFQALDGAVPFSIVRVFTVRAGPDILRGYHAHRQCNQIMVCISGRCEVACADGISKDTYLLDQANRGLLVPPGIWAEQRYLDADTLLMVLCDRLYEEHDYIRDYQQFLEFKKAATFST